MRTIFGKQLIMYLGALIISFVLLGAVLSQVIRDYFTNSQVTALTNSARRVSVVLEGFIRDSGYGVFDVSSFRSLNNLNSQIQNLYVYLNANVIIVNADYNIITGPPQIVSGAESAHDPALEPVMAGEIVVVNGTVNGVYDQPLLTVAHPFYIGERVAGAVLVSISMEELEAAIFGMYRVALICLGVAALFASVLVYLSSRAISRPVKQMNEAARVIAGGDFEKRLQVKSKDEIGQLAEQFNTMAESLQEQEKIRREFIANISHDLRSPLTSMRGFLEAISDGTVSPEQTPYYLGIVLDESERLIKISNDMLDIHRIQGGNLSAEMTSFDINALIRKVVMGFEKRARDKKLIINCSFAHSEDVVRADEGMLARVMYNLLDNAVKFTADGGEISVETAVNEKKLTVSVTDNGRGMTDDEKKRVFDRFFKGDTSRNEDKMGTGLGLSIVREFVKAHGEQITVKSEVGKGTVFTFMLSL